MGSSAREMFSKPLAGPWQISLKAAWCDGRERDDLGAAREERQRLRHGCDWVVAWAGPQAWRENPNNKPCAGVLAAEATFIHQRTGRTFVVGLAVIPRLNVTAESLRSQLETVAAAYGSKIVLPDVSELRALGGSTTRPIWLPLIARAEDMPALATAGVYLDDDTGQTWDADAPDDLGGGARYA